MSFEARIADDPPTILAAETLDRHARAYPQAHQDLLPVGGVYAWRRDGEHHQWNPETIATIQHAVRYGGTPAYEQFSRMVNDESKRRATLRGLLKLVEAPEPLLLHDRVPERGQE